MSDTFPELAEVITELTQPNRINIIQAKRILLATLGDGLSNCPGSSFQAVSFMHVAVIGEVTPCRQHH